MLTLKVVPTLDGREHLGEHASQLHLPPLEPDRSLEARVLELRAENARLLIDLGESRRDLAELRRRARPWWRKAFAR